MAENNASAMGASQQQQLQQSSVINTQPFPQAAKYQ